MGSGDWNDGMNLVGIHGRGESVWLSFFLCEVLKQFTVLARQRGDATFAERCESEAAQLGVRIEQHAWDGGWYRRAYFDDGTPLGSAANSECQIDSISQSWAVISGVGSPERTRQAMSAVYQRLVKPESKLIQLLDPPFDTSDVNPGYIKGYVPGVRENGGQYTHSAIWTAMAFAEMGDAERAWALLAMINPVNHGITAADVATYKVEPYVVSADVVYRFRGLAVSSDYRIAARLATRSEYAASAPAPACRVAWVHITLPLSRYVLSHPRHPGGLARRCAAHPPGWHIAAGGCDYAV